MLPVASICGVSLKLVVMTFQTLNLSQASFTDMVARESESREAISLGGRPSAAHIAELLYIRRALFFVVCSRDPQLQTYILAVQCLVRVGLKTNRRSSKQNDFTCHLFRT